MNPSDRSYPYLQAPYKHVLRKLSRLSQAIKEPLYLKGNPLSPLENSVYQPSQSPGAPATTTLGISISARASTND